MFGVYGQVPAEIRKICSIQDLIDSRHVAQHAEYRIAGSKRSVPIDRTEHVSGGPSQLAARDESSMDNSPMYDQAAFQKETGTLDLEDIALNSLLAVEAEALARIAAMLGELTDAAWFQAERDAMVTRIREHLWDKDHQIFANRFWSGRFL